MANEVSKVWTVMEQRHAVYGQKPAERLYRALGASAIGVRAGYIPSDDVLELLIEVPVGWSSDLVIPNWQGMGHQIITLNLQLGVTTHHLRLFLLSREHRDVFELICDDVVKALEGITDSQERIRALEVCLTRWRRFFERAGPNGLSPEAQQGLCGELTWLKKMLDAGINHLRAVLSWKGADGGYYDFDIESNVVEVKCTRTKEPRRVTISNERQLDERGLHSLHLYALSLQETEAAGLTLSEQVSGIFDALGSNPRALAAFRNALVNAGYLEYDAVRYTRRFLIKEEFFYRIAEGFPRIITLPPGLGNLRYDLFMGSCERFRVDVSTFLDHLKGASQ